MSDAILLNIGGKNAWAWAMERFSAACLAVLTLVLTGVAPAHATPALVVDVASEAVLYEEEAGKPWYPASTTKMMTAFVTFEALRAGEVALDTPVVLSAKAMKQESLKAGLKPGRAMTLEDALFATIAGSANEVAMALAETVAGSEAAFVKRMNAAAARLGMTASRFANPNGLFSARQQVSARDLALLGIALDRGFPEYARFFRATGVVVDGRKVETNNELLTRFPGTVGMKTGFVCASGRNIVALTERTGRRLMVVLLGATTDRERSERAAQLLTQAFAGALPPAGRHLAEIAGDAAARPEDMRQRLCTARAAAYETSRNALFPMGLPGHESYLGAALPPQLHEIRTWNAGIAARVPVPLPRPPYP